MGGTMTNLQPSTSVPLTEEIAIKAIRDFFRDKPFVFFGSGMSCALDPRFGMPALTDELINNVAPNPQSSQQKQQWQRVVESLQNDDALETALDNVTDSELLQEITRVTGRFISSIDREFALKIAKGDVTWPATGFFKRLVDTLPEGDRVLHVLTPNYDTLFEHACDSIGIPYTCGFVGGVERRIDWDAVDQSLLVRARVAQRGRLRTIYKHRKHVRLYKVHGSLNFFFHRNTVVENSAWMWDAPGFSTRVMITPGLSKYQTVQNYRQELLKVADSAIDRASHFLFLGYGFNDTHLEAYITRKLITQGCNGLIVTKDSNPHIKALLSQAENLWLVCKMREGDVDGTSVFNKQYSGWLHLPNKKLWDIDTFTTEILGG